MIDAALILIGYDFDSFSLLIKLFSLNICSLSYVMPVIVQL